MVITNADEGNMRDKSTNDNDDDDDDDERRVNRKDAERDATSCNRELSFSNYEHDEEQRKSNSL